MIGNRVRIAVWGRWALAILASGSLATVALQSSLSALPGVPTINLYDTPSTGNSDPTITAGPDGNAWFIEPESQKVGKITPNGVITEYNLPPGSAPGTIISAGGNLWSADKTGAGLIKTSTSGDSSIIQPPAGILMGLTLTVDPLGNLWTIAFDPGTSEWKLARVTSAGVVSLHTLSDQSARPNSFALGPDGNIWATDSSSLYLVHKIKTDGTVLATYTMPSMVSAYANNNFTTTPDGNLLAAYANSSTIVKLSTDGQVLHEYTMPTTDGGFRLLTNQQRQKSWYVTAANRIGNVAGDGTITEYALPGTGIIPVGIAVNGNTVWYTTSYNDQIGILTYPDDVDVLGDENTAPNDGDANNDGVPDSLQSNVASFVNSVTNQPFSVALADGTCSAYSIETLGTEGAGDPGYSYPLGMVNFRADCATPGFNTVVDMYFFDPPAGDFVLRKYTNGAWNDVSGAVITRTVIDGMPAIKATYTITDGGALDEDSIVNGTVIDPVGLAIEDSGSIPGAPNAGVARSGMSIPTITLVIAISLAIGTVYARHRR